MHRNAFILAATLFLFPFLVYGQQVENVLDAFESISSEPEVIFLKNKIKVPRKKGHLQGVQVLAKNGKEQLILSGSSHRTAYLLQTDLVTHKTDKLITLMKNPFRHAGGIQVSGDYLGVGIEDNYAKNISKICLYNYQNAELHNVQPTITIDRKGAAKRQTAGAVGLLAMDNDYLLVVGNWDSRNWDFYRMDFEKDEQKIIQTFDAPDNWGSYQSINLIMDNEAIYAIGFYKKKLEGAADLILISKRDVFEPIMRKVLSKTFNCKNGVDFSTAVGLQVDEEGKLHIWGTQRDARKEIVVNKFSQQH